MLCALVMVWGSFEEAAIPGVGWLSFIPEIPEAARLSLVLLKPAVDKHVFHQLYPPSESISHGSALPHGRGPQQGPQGDEKRQ